MTVAETPIEPRFRLKLRRHLALIFALLHANNFDARHWPQALGQQFYAFAFCSRGWVCSESPQPRVLSYVAIWN